jgi:hypothetical protein
MHTFEQAARANKNPMVQKIYFIDEFCEKFPGKNIHELDEYEVSELKLLPGNYFHSNEIIIRLKSCIMGAGIVSLKIPFNGKVISIPVSNGQIIRKNSLVIEVEIFEGSDFFSHLLEQNKPILNDTEISILIDDFTKEKSISFTKIAGQPTQYFKTYSENSNSELLFFGLTFENNNGFVYIKFLSQSGNLSLSKKDTIILLFADKSTITYNLQTSAIGKKYYYTNFHPLTYDDLLKLGTTDLLKLKVTSSKNNSYDVFHLQRNFHNSQYKSEIEGQYLLRFMIANFVQVHLDNNLALPSSNNS